MTLFSQFIYEVTNGILLSNSYVIKAVERHLADVERSKSKDYPYKFDEARAERAIGLVKIFKHTAGCVANQNFLLKPYQAFIVGSIFGWVRKDTGMRRFRRAYVEIARKGVKSELAAAIALIMLIFDNEHGAQVFSTATTSDQAKVVFDKAVSMIRKLITDSPRIKQTISVMGKTRPTRIIYPDKESYMEAWSADTGNKDGYASHCAIVDEYHAHKNDAMIGVIESGSGFRLQPLLFIITTAGFDKQSACYKERNVAINILDGIYDNPTYFSIIFTLDFEDDWQDKSKWVKSNPQIGETPTWDFMESEYLKATEGASKEVNFKTKNLNVWTSSHSTWIKLEVYKQVERVLNLEDFKGRQMVAGLDLAAVAGGDITAYVLVFLPTETDSYVYVYPYLFVSEEKVKERKRSDGVDYLQWEREGHLVVIPGNTIDYNVVKKYILKSAEDFDCLNIAYDRWNSSQLVNDLIDEGLKLYKYGAGFNYMDTPVKEIEMMIKQQNIVIHENPALRWMFQNVTLKYDSEGKVKIDKDKSKDKVDGAVAMAMGIGVYLDASRNTEKYTGDGPVLL